MLEIEWLFPHPSSKGLFALYRKLYNFGKKLTTRKSFFEELNVSTMLMFKDQHRNIKKYSLFFASQI